MLGHQTKPCSLPVTNITGLEDDFKGVDALIRKLKEGPLTSRVRVEDIYTIFARELKFLKFTNAADPLGIV
jgi:hypothetical protein